MCLLLRIMSNPWLQVYRRQAFSALCRRSFLRGAFEIHWRARPLICRNNHRSCGSLAGSIDYWSSQFRGQGTRSRWARLRSLESGRTCPCRVLCSLVWAVSLLYFWATGYWFIAISCKALKPSKLGDIRKHEGFFWLLCSIRAVGAGAARTIKCRSRELWRSPCFMC